MMNLERKTLKIAEWDQLLAEAELKRIKIKTPVLDNFGRDLTELAEEGKLDPVVGR